MDWLINWKVKLNIAWKTKIILQNKDFFENTWYFFRKFETNCVYWCCQMEAFDFSEENYDKLEISDKNFEKFIKNWDIILNKNISKIENYLIFVKSEINRFLEIINKEYFDLIWIFWEYCDKYDIEKLFLEILENIDKKIWKLPKKNEINENLLR